MKQSYPNASSGLKLVFIGQILAIVGGFLAGVGAGMMVADAMTGGSGSMNIIAILGSIVALAAYAINVFGLYKASMDDENYRTPMMAAIAVLGVNLLSIFVSGSSLLTTVLSIVSVILNFIVVNGVCQTTGNLLHSVGNEALVDRGNTVSKIYLICTIINVVCTVIGLIPVLNILGGLVSIVAAIVLLVGYILYLSFLSSSSKALA